MSPRSRLSLTALLVVAPSALAAPGSELNPGAQSGGWSHAIPLELPPAPAGLVPQLALAYDFRGGDGVLGRGWSLVGLSRVERKGGWGQGVPAFATDDTFLVDGQALYTSDTALDYRLEQDDDRVFTYNYVDETWVAVRDGWTWVYGGLDGDGNDGCAIEGYESWSHPCESRSDTVSDEGIAAWLLSSVTDPWGNTIQYGYRSGAELDLEAGTRLEGDYAYGHLLDTITYAGGHHVVQFEYASRVDAPVRGDPDSLRVTTGRLEEIQVLSGGSTVASRYAVVYTDESAKACGVAAEQASWAADEGSGGTADSLVKRVVRMENDLGSDAGKSLRCMEHADDTDAWPAADSVDMQFPTGGSGELRLSSLSTWTLPTGSSGGWTTGRAFTEPAFYSHQAVNFDGGPEAELLELQFPVCDAEVSTYTFGGHVFGATWRPVGNGRGGDQVGYRVEGCSDFEMVANLWSVDADSGRFVTTESPVLRSLLDELAGAAITSNPAAFAFVDIDRDGRTDVLTSVNGGDVRLHRDNGDGTARNEEDLTLYSDDRDAEVLGSALFVDIDGDGLVDLVWQEDSDVLWLPNNGQAPYFQGAGSADTLTLPVTLSGDVTLASLVWADVNGDGVVDVTVASDGIPQQADPVSIIEDTDLDPDGVYLGKGDGSFVLAEKPGLPATDDGAWVKWLGMMNGVSTTPAHHWAGQSTWTYADLDHDGRVEVLDAVGDGLPYPYLASDASCEWSGTEPQADCQEVDEVGYAQLVADWTGDGFDDVLYMERPRLESWESSGNTFSTTTSGTGHAILYPNTRGLAEERVTAIETAWGGEIALSYGLSSDNGLNGALPWAVDVIARVVDEAGTTDFSFDGGVWWPELGRFMGFRDAVVERQGGAITHVRYATTPWAGGREVYRSDRRSDGSMEFFRYNSAREPGSGATALDLDAPFWNPVRGRCEAWIGYPTATGAQGIDVGELIAECECSIGGQGEPPPPDGGTGGSCPNNPGDGPPLEEPPPLGGEPPVVCMAPGGPPPSGPPPSGPPPGPPPPQGPALPPPPTGSPTPPSCEALGATALFEMYGWASVDPDYEESATAEGNLWSINSSTSWEVLGGDDVAASAWGSATGLAGGGGLARPDYALTWTELPAGLSEPNGAPPSRTRAGGPSEYVMTAEAWRFNAEHRPTEHHRKGQVDLSGDEQWVELEWGAYDAAEEGQQLLGRVSWAESRVMDRLEESFSYGAGWSERTGTTQTRAGAAWAAPSSRSTSTTWAGDGEVLSELDPDGVLVTYTRNVCGQVEERDLGPRLPETFGYDAACRKLSWDWLSGHGDWSYDAYGRVEAYTLAPGGPSATVVESTSRSGNTVSVVTGSGADGALSLRVSTLDVWGRPTTEESCETAGGSSPTCIPGTSSRVVRGYALDGTPRFITAPYDPDASSPETLTAEWSFRDEFGRVEWAYSPAPVQAQDYVGTWRGYRPGHTEEEGPTGLACEVEFTTLTTVRSCDGTILSEETRDGWGRTLTVAGPDGVAEEREYDAFDRVSERALDRAVTFADGTVTPSTSMSWTAGGRLASVVDPSGLETSFSYDLAGRQTGVTVDGPTSLPLTVSQSWYADVPVGGALVTVGHHEDVHGNVSWTLGDGLGRTFSTTAPTGDTAWMAWDSRGLLAEHTDIDGIVTGYSYDALGRLIAEDHTGLSGSPSWVYDAAGRVLSVEDRDGVSTEVVYARNGQVLGAYRPRSAAGDWTLSESAYADDGLPTWQWSGGVETEYGYDTLRRLTEVCEAPSGPSCQRLTEYEYDAAQRLWRTSVSGSGSTVMSEREYDDLGNVVGRVHPDRTEERFAYYRSGQLATHTSPLGRMSSWAYDDFGRVVSEDLPRQGARAFAYVEGEPTPDGNFGLLTERYEPDGGVFSTLADWAGRGVVSTDAYGDTTTAEYVGSQLRHVEFASGGSALAHEGYAYDAAGRVSVRWGPLDDAAWSALGSSVPDPAAGDYAFAYGWTEAGRLESREGPNDRTEWSWADGVRVGEVIAGVSEADFGYAAATPRLAWKAVGSGSDWRETTYAYDALGRLSSAETDDGSEVVEATWSNRDVYGAATVERRKVNGVTESEAVSAFDSRGRLLSRELSTPTRVGVAEYAWTDDSELAELHTQWNGGSWRGLRYDRAGAEGELTAVAPMGGGAAYASISGRDALGRITQVELADGTLVERGYDLLGRVERASAMRGTGDLREQLYSYDHRGRLSGVETSDAVGVRSSATYGYAEPGWLTDETVVDGAGTRTTVYGHDVAGNRTSEAVTIGGVTTTRSLTYAYGNRLTSVDGVAVAWNAFGETTTDHRGADIDRAGDGAEVALSSVTGTALYAFTRGPGGEAVEVEEAVSGDVRSFLWGAGEADVPVSVLDEAGDDQATIAVEGLVVGRLDSGAFVGMAPDGRGGVLLDGSTFLEGARAFGEGASPAAGSSERRVWAMLERLPGTAYSLPRRRLYDAEVGRFASADPIGLAGGDHRFVYVGGNPTAGVDPSGLVASSFGMPMPTASAAPYGGGGTGMGRMEIGTLGWIGSTGGEYAASIEARLDEARRDRAWRRWKGEGDMGGGRVGTGPDGLPGLPEVPEPAGDADSADEDPCPPGACYEMVIEAKRLRRGAGEVFAEEVGADAWAARVAAGEGNGFGEGGEGGSSGGDRTGWRSPSLDRKAKEFLDRKVKTVIETLVRQCAANPAACQAVKDIAWASVHVGLSTCGQVPGLGEGCDGADVGVSLAEGDEVGAATSAAAMLPAAGALPGMVKAARNLDRIRDAVKVLEALDKAKDAEKVAETALDAEKAKEVVEAVSEEAQKRFFRGGKPGQAPDFTPRPNEFKIDAATGTVKPTHGVSVFDNPESVSSKGFVPHEVDQATIPDTLRINQRGADPRHYEIMPAEGANLTPDQFTSACQRIGCKP